MATAILITAGLTLTGCVHHDGINTVENVSSVIIPSKVTLDEKMTETPQVVVNDPQLILLVELYLKNHTSGWKETWHTPMAPQEYIVINQTDGSSFSFGYGSNCLIKYKQDYYRYKQVDQSEVEKLKNLIKTIKDSSNQRIDPTLKTAR